MTDPILSGSAAAVRISAIREALALRRELKLDMSTVSAIDQAHLGCDLSRSNFHARPARAFPKIRR